jgi:hypothetical protein
LNDIGRNFLLGSGKKIAKCLMRTFTCRSTFLYTLPSALSESFAFKEVYSQKGLPQLGRGSRPCHPPLFGWGANKSPTSRGLHCHIVK